MKKWKATVLLTVILVLTAVLTAAAFARFPIGTKDYNGFLGAVQTDYDLSGGTAYTLTLASDNVKDVDDIEEVVDTFKHRLDLLDYRTYSVKAIKNVDEAVKDYDIRIEARGNVGDNGKVDTATLAQDVAVVAAYGELTFYGGTEQNPTEKILTDGKVVADSAYAGSYNDGSSTTYQVSITFTDYGYTELSKLLKDNSTYYVQISLGDTVLLPGTSALSANYINNKTLYITTGSEASAKQAALQIKTGGLAYKYEISDGVEISSPLGSNVELKCFIALAALVVAAIVFGFVANGKYGLVQFFSMILFVDLYLFLLIAIPGVKVSLGGVIGAGLAIILAADGFFITNKRIKEEYARGKTVKSAVKSGFGRALAPVAGSTGIAFAAAIILFAFAGGIVKNFALVFAIGAVVSAFTTLLFARMFSTLLLAEVEYKESFLRLKRAENGAATAEEKGE